jgi:hypothetical protein
MIGLGNYVSDGLGAVYGGSSGTGIIPHGGGSVIRPPAPGGAGVFRPTRTPSRGGAVVHGTPHGPVTVFGKGSIRPSAGSAVSKRGGGVATGSLLPSGGGGFSASSGSGTIPGLRTAGVPGSGTGRFVSPGGTGGGLLAPTGSAPATSPTSAASKAWAGPSAYSASMPGGGYIPGYPSGGGGGGGGADAGGAYVPGGEEIPAEEGGPEAAPPPAEGGLLSKIPIWGWAAAGLGVYWLFFRRRK